MKFLFEAEDCVVGIIVGLILVGLSGRFFQLPGWNLLWGIIFIVSLIFTILDVTHTFTDFGGHILLIILLLLNNIIDFVIEIALAVKYLNLGITLPYVSQYMPLLDNPLTLLILGIFFVASSIFWLITFPFMH